MWGEGFLLPSGLSGLNQDGVWGRPLRSPMFHARCLPRVFLLVVQMGKTTITIWRVRKQQVGMEDLWGIGLGG